MPESLYDKALRLLGRPVQKAADPDDADSRVGGDAEPDDKKLAEAGKEAAAGAQAQGGPEGEAGGVPADPGEGEEGHAEPDADNAGGPSDGDADNEDEDGEFDEHGNDDMDEDEIRELRKAFGLNDFDDVKDTKKDTNISAMLGQILSYVKKQDAFMQNLNKELADLKAKHGSGKADEDMRVTMKSMQEKVDVVHKLLENLPRTAPAAAQPKAFQKAINVDNGQSRLTLADVTSLAMNGKISASEAARLTRQINHTTPASAGF